MIIVIRKQPENDFVAFVADPVCTYWSDQFANDFAPFKNGIAAKGNTWAEALENIKGRINEYRNVFMNATRREPEFIEDGKATIITEKFDIDDFLN